MIQVSCLLVLAQALTGWDLLWRFVNSPLGVALVSGLIIHLLVWVFTKKPAAQKFFEQNKGFFFDAVRFAEEAVPDGAPGSASARAKAALDYLQKLEHPISEASEALLKHGIEAAHAVESSKDDPGGGTAPVGVLPAPPALNTQPGAPQVPGKGS